MIDDKPTSNAPPAPSPATHVPPTKDYAFANVASDIKERDLLVKVAEEYNHYLSVPYTVESTFDPAERFVFALFPILELRETTSDMETPPNMTAAKLRLPIFQGRDDPQLHIKLRDLQHELRNHQVHLRDWPKFAATACDDLTHQDIRDWVFTGHMRWHHFVLAIICENDLYDYHNVRDSAFAQFVKSVDESPEAAVM